MFGLAKKSFSTKILIGVFALLMVAGCKTEKASESEKTPPGTEDAKTAEQLKALTTQLEEEKKSKAAVAAELEKSQKENGKNKNTAVTPDISPPVVNAFVDKLMEKSKYQEFLKYFLESMEPYLDEKLFSIVFDSIRKDMSDSETFSFSTKSDFYTALQNNSWSTETSFVANIFFSYPLTCKARMELNSTPELTESVDRFAWFSSSVSYEKKIEILKKLATLFFQENSVDKLNQKTDADKKSFLGAMDVIDYLEFFLNMAENIRQCDSMSPISNDIGIDSNSKAFWVASFSTKIMGDDWFEDYLTETAYYIHQFFDPTNQPIVPAQQIRIVSKYFENETSKEAQKRADQVYAGLIKADPNLEKNIKKIEPSDLVKDEGAEANDKNRYKRMIRIIVWEKPAEKAALAPAN